MEESDVLKIRSGFMKKMVTIAIEKAARKALGCQVDIILDPDSDFVIDIDDEFINGHVRLNFAVERNIISKLLE